MRDEGGGEGRGAVSGVAVKRGHLGSRAKARVDGRTHFPNTISLNAFRSPWMFMASLNLIESFACLLSETYARSLICGVVTVALPSDFGYGAGSSDLVAIGLRRFAGLRGSRARHEHTKLTNMLEGKTKPHGQQL